MALTIPVVVMLVLGALLAAEEQEEMVAAREVRRDAGLVELLSSIAVSLQVEGEVISLLQEASSLGFSIDVVEQQIDNGGFDESAVVDADIDPAPLFEALDTQDPGVWADAEAVETLRRGWSEFSRYRAATVGESADAVDADEFADVRRDMMAAVETALAAQTEQLELSVGRVEMAPELFALVQSMGPSRQALGAVHAEREALANYLLPISPERPAELRYRDLVEADSHLRFSLQDLEAKLPPAYAASLAQMRTSPSHLAYSELNDEAINRTVPPAEEVEDLLSLFPVGVVIFDDGYEKVQVLSGIDHQLTIDFAAGAEQLEADANRRLYRVLGVGVLAAIGVLAISYFTIRSITRPVRSLLDRAQHITHGVLETERPAGGPADIDLVHQALDDMTDNLGTLSAQAEALSAGRLDDEVFSHQVIGPLGASVHGSVARLRSMTTRLEHEATHDSLTGLPNRAAVFALLDRTLTGPVGSRSPLAVIMLDLDGFKQANDNMGHAIGDEVLCHVADRLVARAEGHFVARLGGDEFMIVMVGSDGHDQVLRVARQAVDSVALPMSLSCGTLDVSASAGVVRTGPGEWLAPSEVLRRVDLAMYEAKSDTPGEVVQFDQRLHDSLLATTQLSGELRKALSQNEFHLNLQPILTTGDGVITGYEALIRWTSPVRGPVSPGLFIGVAEQSELITHIDTWVIRESAKVLASWRGDPEREHLTLSINVSARHLSRPDLAVEIDEAIRRHDLRADRIVIEITESQLIPNLSRAEDNLRRLKEIGVKLAIDDFGTGYASVAHLRRVAFDRLKIDQSFLAHLSDETDRSLASLLVSVGLNLQLEVVAEGIETEEQWQWASDAGCTHAQGYLIGRPGPVDEIDPTIVHNPRAETADA
ncbi:MAG: EAL domain-containing protein [Actinomycetota bacterium]